jgi:sugar/nucleoside kinase (ribokinase family)
MRALFPFETGRDFGLLTIGDPNLDRVFRVERLPSSGEKLMASPLGIFGGGTAANVACAAARLGVTAAAFGRVGDDADGMFLGRSFQAFGVSTAYLRVSTGTPSSAAMIMIEPGGEKALLYAPMPAEVPMDVPTELSIDLPTELPAQPLADSRTESSAESAGGMPEPGELGDALSRSSVVYATPYNFEELATLSRLARQRGVCVAIDLEALALAGIQDIASWLQLADLVFLNEAAFRAATGEVPGAESINALLRWGPAAIVVTLGAAGALAATSNAFVDHAAFPAQAVDTTGAGDCFAAAFIAAALAGDSLEVSLRFACAAASIAVTQVGARTGFPDRRAVDVLLTRAAASCLEHSTQESKERNVC